jgi:transcriptional regulator GlxA family with amidase domain
MGAIPHTGLTPCNVVILAFEDVTLSDICGPADVFELANTHSTAGLSRPYRVSIASVQGGTIRTSSGISIETLPVRQIDFETLDTLIVPGGGPPHCPPVPQDLVCWLAAKAGSPARLCSICTGAFLLAEANLLAGVRVATHWQAAPLLAARYPDIRVESNPIFVRDGGIWSSAGFAGALDLALAIVEEDHSHDLAMRVTQSLVLFLRRSGDQPQVSVALSTQSACDPTFARLHAWMMQNLTTNLRIDVLADRAGMAPRTFARRYVEKIGRTPAKTVEIFRLEAAQRDLGQSDASLKQIARTCGFGNLQNLRRAFLRSYGVHPERYRSDLMSVRAAVDAA